MSENLDPDPKELLAMKEDHRLLHTIAQLASVVRARQVHYFRNRTNENLIASKMAERELDLKLKEAGYV